LLIALKRKGREGRTPIVETVNRDPDAQPPRHTFEMVWRVCCSSLANDRFPAQMMRSESEKGVYHVRVSSSTTRNHRNWKTGDAFTVGDATDLYEVDRWGKGYFSISSSGHVLVHPTKDPARSIDLKQLTDHLMLRGISLPVLIRFRDILRHRVGDIHNAFRAAITQHQYDGRYVCVYPIKVNQQRQVVEEVLDFGREYGFGLEA
jgi:arginine decarboxylase-like protein